MYKFTDPGEPASEEYLPSEAVFIDGVCIDQVIPGYQTLTVSGREPVSMDYSERKIGNNLYLEDYYQTSRIIVVRYLLQADSPEKLVQKFDKLNGILNFRDAKIQFADDPGRYYIGSKTEAEAPPVGVFSCVSTFQIYCPDPHKYSVATKQFTATRNADGILELTIDNEGTADVPIDYTIKHNHDNGYLGFASERGVLQTGKIDEVDIENYRQSEELIATKDFSGWKKDTGVNVQDTAKLTNGTLRVATVNGKSCLMMDDPGTGTGTTPHGGMITMDIPPDSEGESGATDFYCYFNIWFETSMAHQIGTMGINWLGDDNKLIFSYIIEKVTPNSNTARVTMSVGGDKQSNYWTTYFPPTMFERDNPTNEGRGHIDMLKEGGTISAYYWGVRHGITVSELANTKCKRIQIYMGKYGTSALVERMYLREFRFQKNYVEKWKDVPNRFPNNSEVYVDGKEGKIYTDGILRMDDEIKGSQYFLAPPGQSKVRVYHSDFSIPEPDVTATIREGWL